MQDFVGCPLHCRVLQSAWWVRKLLPFGVQEREPMEQTGPPEMSDISGLQVRYSTHTINAGSLDIAGLMSLSHTLQPQLVKIFADAMAVFTRRKL